MRLAIVTQRVRRADGQGRVAYEIARHALSKGARVTLLADQVDEDLLDQGADWVPVQPSLRRPDLLTVRQFVHMADRRLRSLSDAFDAVQGFGYTLTLPHQVSACQFVHDAWGRCPFHAARVHRGLYGLYQGAYTRLNSRWERTSFSRAETVVACSERVKQELMAIGVGPCRIRVILNAVDPREFCPGPADRTALGLPADVPLALFAGDIRLPRKNLDTVLRSLSLVQGVHLAVVGGIDNSPYPRMARTLGLADRVHFLGFRRDVATVMRASDLFVFPSRYEPFGIVVLEAMATALPIITAVTVGAAQIITPESGLVLPDPNDVAALADALGALLADAGARTRMGRAARLVAERQTWSGMAEQYWQLYREFTN